MTQILQLSDGEFKITVIKNVFGPNGKCGHHARSVKRIGSLRMKVI
jgi:hypothetical protein